LCILASSRILQEYFKFIAYITIRNMEIYAVSRVTFQAGIMNVSYL
jgi:hypothetical protein